MYLLNIICWLLALQGKNICVPILMVYSLYVSASDCIKLTEKLIPSHAIKGEDVVLECLYDLQGDSLYSVKWYRNGQEFYRHIPTDKPSTVVFRKPGLIVDVSTENNLKYHYKIT